MDPRRYQIAALATLLAYGVFWLRFDLRPEIVATLLTVSLTTQWLCWRTFVSSEPARRSSGVATERRRVDFKSALISALSLCLLLRTESPFIAAYAAVITIASKFAIRVGAKHVFNPTNVGIAVTVLATSGAWVSPGQWGDAALLALLIASLGIIVVTRASRVDVTAAFVLAYAAMLVGRSVWLGEPLAIPLHRLTSGAFLIFAFFMISDPKTTPDTRAGRIVFAVLVAAGAYYVHFRLFRPNGLIWSLVALSPLVPILDRMSLSAAAGDGRRAKAGVGGRYAEVAWRAAGRGAGLAAAGAAGGVLRLLRGPRGHEDLQPRVAGRPRP